MSAALCTLPCLANAAELSGLTDRMASYDPELEDTIFVPFQGTWVQGANTFIFTAGDTRESNWVMGNLIGGGGQVSRYLWLSQTATSGTFYFDTTQGRQGPIVATLSNNNRTMTWRFGAETTILTRVN
jgi:hypothetical protein